MSQINKTRSFFFSISHRVLIQWKGLRPGSQIPYISDISEAKWWRHLRMVLDSKESSHVGVTANLGCQFDIPGRKEQPQLRNCLHQIDMWDIVLVFNWCSRASSVWVVLHLSSCIRRSSGEQARGNEPVCIGSSIVSISAPVLASFPQWQAATINWINPFTHKLLWVNNDCINKRG